MWRKEIGGGMTTHGLKSMSSPPNLMSTPIYLGLYDTKMHGMLNLVADLSIVVTRLMCTLIN